MTGTSGTQLEPNRGFLILSLLTTTHCAHWEVPASSIPLPPHTGYPGDAAIRGGQDAGDTVALTQCHSGTRRAPVLCNEWLHPQHW